MTNTLCAGSAPTAAALNGTPPGIETFDLTPEGLADTPAHQEDSESIVHTGNS